MEAIIEDEVTSRFEAEELKNWNLLTRTNRYYEFISWRLSVIWFIGFFIRYFILMPFRVIICFVGVSWLVTFGWLLIFFTSWSQIDDLAGALFHRTPLLFSNQTISTFIPSKENHIFHHRFPHSLTEFMMMNFLCRTKNHRNDKKNISTFIFRSGYRSNNCILTDWLHSEPSNS